MAVKSTEFNKGRAPLSAVSLYYKRLLIFFDSIGTYNQVRPLYTLLSNGEWMPAKLKKVYHDQYNDKFEQVKDAYQKAEADIEVDWGKVVESIKELGLSCKEQDTREFRSLARATEEEVDFRSKVRKHVESAYFACEKEIARRNINMEPKPIYVETLRKLIIWFQNSPQRKPKKKS